MSASASVMNSSTAADFVHRFELAKESFKLSINEQVELWFAPLLAELRTNLVVEKIVNCSSVVPETSQLLLDINSLTKATPTKTKSPVKDNVPKPLISNGNASNPCTLLDVPNQKTSIPNKTNKSSSSSEHKASIPKTSSTDHSKKKSHVRDTKSDCQANNKTLPQSTKRPIEKVNVQNDTLDLSTKGKHPRIDWPPTEKKANKACKLRAHSKPVNGLPIVDKMIQEDDEDEEEPEVLDAICLANDDAASSCSESSDFSVIDEVSGDAESVPQGTSTVPTPKPIDLPKAEQTIPVTVDSSNSGSEPKSAIPQPQSAKPTTQPRRPPQTETSPFQTICLICSFDGCNQRWQTKELLNEHLTKTHQCLPIACSNCSATFAKVADYIKHFTEDHSTVKEISCGKCGQTSVTPSLAHKHRLLYHEEGEFRCTACPFIGQTRWSVMEHHQQDHQVVTGATAAPTVSSSAPSSSRGSAVALPAKPLQKFIAVKLGCLQMECTESFTCRGRLNEHLAGEHQIYTQRCIVENCGQSFEESKQLSAHIYAAHRGISEWKCAHCFFVSPGYRDLSLHTYFCHYEGTFKCSTKGCPFVATTRQEAIDHFDSVHLKTREKATTTVAVAVAPVEAPTAPPEQKEEAQRGG